MGVQRQVRKPLQRFPHLALRRRCKSAIVHLPSFLRNDKSAMLHPPHFFQKQKTFYVLLASFLSNIVKAIFPTRPVVSTIAKVALFTHLILLKTTQMLFFTRLRFSQTNQNGIVESPICFNNSNSDIVYPPHSFGSAIFDSPTFFPKQPKLYCVLFQKYPNRYFGIAQQQQQ